MGITYKAFDTNLRCHVALKVITSAYLNSDLARQRFLREARAAAALRHPNVATVFHLGSEDDNYFYAMEFVDGETVEAFMKRGGAVSAALALEIAAQVSRALGAAQKQGLVHRDIKPSNLMLVWEDDDLTVKVIDFGLAKSSVGGGEDTATLTMGGFLGTPHFASPEQLDEKEIDVRSDIYSLGVTLWYMLAGRTPFSGSLAQVMSQHLHREPPFQSLDGQTPEVIALLRHMMAKDPADRPQSPTALRHEIEACRASLGAAAAVGSAGPVRDDTFETTVLPEPLTPEEPDMVSGAVYAGRYRLLNEVTASDHGRVFRAERMEDQTTVGVLILHETLLASAEAFTRLENDVTALQALRAPAFQKIFSLERAPSSSFLTVEWLTGPTLLDLLRVRRALPLAEAVFLLEPLASAFDELAAAQQTCPDIGLHEIILEGLESTRPVPPDARPRFLPLAIPEPGALAADATMVATSFALMQQTGAFTGDPARAAVFAVATLAYEMLGGVRGGSSSGGPVPIPGLSEAGNAALRQAMTPQPGFSSSGAFVAALSAAAPAPSVVGAAPPPAPAPPPETGPPPLPVTPPQPKSSNMPLLLGLIGLGGMFLLIVGGVTVMSFFPGKKSPAGAEASGFPQPTPAPRETPVAAVEPTPAPEAPRPHTDYTDTLALAKKLQEQDSIAAAIDLYAKLAMKYPGEKEPFLAMEAITAGLLARADRMTPTEKAALRQPLEQAAAAHVRSAQMFLGQSLFKTEPVQALKWYLAAAEQGQTEAMVVAGKMLSNGEGSPGPDLKAAVTWFTRAADAGNPEGIFLLGECFVFGKGVAQDPKRGIELLSMAAGLNNVRAMDMLGSLYRKGVPGLLTPDPDKAVRFYTDAAARGFLDSQGNLGVLSIRGEGVPKDEAKALGLFKDGAEKGNASCMFYYALCLEGGVGTEKNESSAREWYEKSARGGDRRAMDWFKSRNLPLPDAP